MNITIKLGTESIDSAIRRIEAYKKSIPEKLQTLCKRLSDIGADRMREVYGNAAYAGTNDVQVRVDWENDKAVVIAYGETVGFIEFGTGVKYPIAPHAAANNIPPRGSYGKGKGGTGRPWMYAGEPGNGNVGHPFTTKDGKVVAGVSITRGNPAACAFPAAVDAIRDRMVEVAREVFGT